MHNITYRIAQIDDVSDVLEYATQRHTNPQLDPIENQIVVWNSNFRQEALEHYFRLGWSFVAVGADGKIQGFFLGQPLLFFDKQTQTLWVEFIEADNSAIFTELVEIAYKLAREKHFQRVIYAHDPDLQNLQKAFPFARWERQPVLLKTTK